MYSAPPTPLRPLTRTRRRSSSFSTPSSSFDQQTQSDVPRRGSRQGGKRCKRSISGEVQAQPPSPLKRSQAVIPTSFGAEDDLGTSLWTHPSPFTTSFASPFSTASTATAPSTAASLFSASASDFSLPSAGRWPRGRNASSESAGFASTSSLSSSPKASFEDSSCSSASTSTYQSDSSPPQSHGTSASPRSASFTFSCARPTFSLRRASSCHSPMLCETGSIGDATPMAQAEQLHEAEQLDHEAERLHQVAFEQLRSSTRVEEEGFVERMRRWEAEQDVRVRENSLEMASVHEAGVAADDEGAGSGSSGEVEEEEEEVEITLDLGTQSARSSCPLSGAELDELSRRLKGGACELEDFSLVREVQARRAGAKWLQMQA
ncbi:hypothetical protein JCM11641_007457 [Rhodosporidiobolus odoratus]